ncbi:MAG: hypothetical protein UW24_C0006G0040 [Parcubacteria group bacterium GW2011_GWA2_44_12]|nr:MAG: hypothetical protein UW24_C0006G0040 [Parcubacteria group bacterium GW2011_GWA2_44_12]
MKTIMSKPKNLKKQKTLLEQAFAEIMQEVKFVDVDVIESKIGRKAISKDNFRTVKHKQLPKGDK